MHSQTKLRSNEALSAGAAWALCGATAVLCATVALGWSARGEGVPLPFVWWDVALVYLLGAIPAAVEVAAGVRMRASTPVVSGAAFGGLLSALFIPAISVAGFVPPGLLRWLEGICLAIGAALLVAVLAQRPLRPVCQSGWRSTGPKIALGAVLVWLVPAAYAATRVQNHIDRLQALLDEARVAESRRLAHSLFAFDPSLQFQGVPPHPERETRVRTLVTMLDNHVQELASEVARPLPPDATEEDRLARAEELLILSRESEAINVLAPLVAAELPDARACGLLGVIHETLEDFPAARATFEQAAGLWEAQPPSAERNAGLAQAVRGIAYAERKLGRYGAAEAAYQRLLAIAPTADTHFLLARFYEDTQQAAAARSHARRAMELAPDEYAEPGRELIDALAVRHFGCLPVYLEERSRDGR